MIEKRHTFRRTRSLLLAQLSAFAILACTDPTTPPQASVGTRSAMSPSSATGRKLKTFDDAMEEISRRTPGFAGFSLDEAGELVAYSTDTTAKESMRSALSQFLLSNISEDKNVLAAKISRLRVRKTQYTFVQLASWYRELLPLLSGAGIRLIDIDENRNRIVLGVRSGGAVAAAHIALTRSGVPEAAMVVEVTGSINEQMSLQTEIRPVTAGHRILAGAGACTLGMNVYYAHGGEGDIYYRYDGNRYFVTAAHCTAASGVLNYGIAGQPDLTKRVGIEVADPTFFDSSVDANCPASYVCRYSDAALIRYDEGISWRHGQLPNVTGTTAPFSYGGFKTMISDDGYVDASFASLYNGKGIAVLGQAGGRSLANISNTCVSVGQDNNGVPTGRWMLCQFMSNASTIGGDSGGPVTSYPSVTCSQGGCIQNLGIHWGRQNDANGTLRQVFSPFYFVSAELANAMGGGSLTAHACATPGCYPY